MQEDSCAGLTAKDLLSNKLWCSIRVDCYSYKQLEYIRCGSDWVIGPPVTKLLVPYGSGKPYLFWKRPWNSSIVNTDSVRTQSVTVRHEELWSAGSQIRWWLLCVNQQSVLQSGLLEWTNTGRLKCSLTYSHEEGGVLQNCWNQTLQVPFWLCYTRRCKVTWRWWCMEHWWNVAGRGDHIATPSTYGLAGEWSRVSAVRRCWGAWGNCTMITLWTTAEVPA